MSTVALRVADPEVAWPGPTPFPRLLRLMLPLAVALVAFQVMIFGLQALIPNHDGMIGQLIALLANVVFLRAAVSTAITGNPPLRDGLGSGYLTLGLIFGTLIVFAIMFTIIARPVSDLLLIVGFAVDWMTLCVLVGLTAPWLLREIASDLSLRAGAFWPRIGCALAVGLFWPLLGMVPGIALFSLGVTAIDWVAAVWLCATRALGMVLLAWLVTWGARPEIRLAP